MNHIQGLKFKIAGTEYIITGVWWQGGEKVEYEFKSTDWDKPIEYFKMEAKKFESKVTIDNFVGV